MGSHMKQQVTVSFKEKRSWVEESNHPSCKSVTEDYAIEAYMAKGHWIMGQQSVQAYVYHDLIGRVYNIANQQLDSQVVKEYAMEAHGSSNWESDIMYRLLPWWYHWYGHCNGLKEQLLIYIYHESHGSVYWALLLQLIWESIQWTLTGCK